MELMAKDIYSTRMRDRFWGIGERTPNRKRLRNGDKVVFYIGGQEGPYFVGRCALASDVLPLQGEKKVSMGHGIGFYQVSQGVDLADIEVWKEPRPLNSELVKKLDFISNKDQYWAHFQGGVIAISEDDFETIINPSRVEQSKEIESQAEFVLEKFLHEFIVTNFDRINFGSKLEMYKDEDGRNGSEYPTSAGYIDILCRDKDIGDFVVIELKKGFSTDTAIGQTLRYIGWVETNLAMGKRVRGLIIARDFDERLRYSLPRDPQIGVKTYQIDFKLRDPHPNTISQK